MQSQKAYVPEDDLQDIVKALAPIALQLKKAKIFLTGGTGFFGIWLIESFLALNQHYQLDAELYVLTRNPEKFLKQFPLLKTETALHFIEGDIRNFQSPTIGITHIIHGATAVHQEQDAVAMLDTLFTGTKHLLDFARNLKTQPKVLLISSGAVYGPQPVNITHIPETASISPNLYDVKSAYGVGKSLAEHLCYQYHSLYNVPIKIARCFSFVGPYLPLDGRFAMGNFIADRLASRTITVKATQQVFRSYQYASDLAIWLWTILLSGKEVTPYNVGSDDAYTVQEMARLVAEMGEPHLPVSEAPLCEPLEINRYVPSIAFAEASLGLYNRITIKDAILKTVAWHTHNYV